MPVFYTSVDATGVITGVRLAEKELSRLSKGFEDLERRGVRSINNITKSFTRMSRDLSGIVNSLYTVLDNTNYSKSVQLKSGKSGQNQYLDRSSHPFDNRSNNSRKIEYIGGIGQGLTSGGLAALPAMVNPVSAAAMAGVAVIGGALTIYSNSLQEAENWTNRFNQSQDRLKMSLGDSSPNFQQIGAFEKSLKVKFLQNESEKLKAEILVSKKELDELFNPIRNLELIDSPYDIEGEKYTLTQKRFIGVEKYTDQISTLYSEFQKGMDPEYVRIGLSNILTDYSKSGTAHKSFKEYLKNLIVKFEEHEKQYEDLIKYSLELEQYDSPVSFPNGQYRDFRVTEGKSVTIIDPSLSTKAREAAMRMLEHEIAVLTLDPKGLANFEHQQRVDAFKAQGVDAESLSKYNEAYSTSQKNAAIAEAKGDIEAIGKVYQNTVLGVSSTIQSISAEMQQFRDSAVNACAVGVLSWEEYRDVLTQIDEIQHERLVQSSSDFASGAERAFKNYSANAMDAGKNIETFLMGGFAKTEDALVTFIRTGEFEFSSFVDSLLADMTRLIVQQAIMGPILGGIGSLFGGNKSSADSVSGITDIVKFGASFVSMFGKAHRGGVAGIAMTGSTWVSPLVFAGASRYHRGGVAGLKSGEIPAILKHGESIFTPQQSATLAPLSQVERAAQNSSGSSSVVNNISITPPSGYEAHQESSSNGRGGEDIKVTFSRMAAAEASRFGSPLNRTLQTGGFKSQPVRRGG